MSKIAHVVQSSILLPLLFIFVVFNFCIWVLGAAFTGIGGVLASLSDYLNSKVFE